MLKKLSLVLICLIALITPALGQSMSVTATLTDSDSTVWANGTCSIQLYNGQSIGYQYNGVAVPIAPTCAINGSGVLSATMYNTSTMSPVAAQYQLNICSNTSAPCSSFLTTVTTTNQTSAFSALLVAPRFSAVYGSYGYTDVEVKNAVAGVYYYNVTLGVIRQFNGTSWATIGAGSGGPTFLTGATSRYDMLPIHISGSSLLDQSGSGNNGTFGSTAPTSIPTGLVFSNPSGVSLPSVLNNTRTFLVALYIPPLPSNNTGYTPGYNSILSPSQGAGGFALLNSYSIANSFLGNGDAFAPSIFAGGTFGRACNTMVSGYHVFGVTLGTNTSSDPDVIYVDGVPCSSYNYSASASSGVMSSGNYFLGSTAANTFANLGIVGTLYFSETFSTELTPAQVATEAGAISNSVASRGVPLTPTPIGLALPEIIGSGDSITYGFGATTSWIANLTLTNQPTYVINNLGITGIFLQAIDGSMSNREVPLCPNVGGPTIDILFAGTNDIASTIWTPAQTLIFLSGAIQQAKKAGCVVGIGTMISRNGFDTQKDTYDALILTNWKALGADFVVDFAADPKFGADGASLNPNPTACSGGTCFQSDNTHPTTAGQIIMGADASNAFNYYFGYNKSNPNIVTTNSYSMVAGDGYVTANPSGAATYSLPDCTGQSGAVYSINNPQSTHTLSVVGLNSTTQPINGLATTISIPSNATALITDVPNAKTVSGCHWDMIVISNSTTGISGATSGQALIAGSATTATSSIPLAGTGTAIVTGPNSRGNANNNIVDYTADTTGQVMDSGVNIGQVATLTGTQTLTNKSLTTPTLTGTPVAPTATSGTNTTQIATTAFVATAVARTANVATLASGTVTVSTAAACTPSATCTYKLTNCALNSSTAVGTLSVGTISVGTSFVINSYTSLAALAVDSSKVCWQIN